MADDQHFTAITAALHDLARGYVPPYDTPEFSLPVRSANRARGGKVVLPGPDNEAKQALEAELTSLANRIKYLEAKASTVNHQTLPDTPSGLGDPASPFTASGANGHYRAPKRQDSGSARLARVTSILAFHSEPRILTEEDFAQLREHVQKQSQEIKSLRDTISSLGDQVRHQQERTQKTLVKVEAEDVDKLRRELHKHQQANEAFQDALREIGRVITNVARGNLEKKLTINPLEMDPEITTFKVTINNMMDQLSVFASEVSRVAEEVGTEGKLGGQAYIADVSGIWKTLTTNGKWSFQASSNIYTCTDTSQSTGWQQTLLTKCERLPTLRLL